MHLDCDGFRFELERSTLEISHAGRLVMSLPTMPKAEEEEFQPAEWEPARPDHFSMTVKGLGSLHLAAREGHACYWIETDRQHRDDLRATHMSPSASPAPMQQVNSDRAGQSIDLKGPFGGILHNLSDRCSVAT